MIQQRKLKIKGIYLLIGFMLLCLIAGIAAWWNLSQQDHQADGYSVAVARNGETVKTFTLKEIENMPYKKLYAKLQSAQHENAEGTFRGPELRDVLNRADKRLLKECRTFICVAGDGYSSALSREEIQQKDYAIVAYEKDGKPFEHFNEGGEGPMRMLVAGDSFGNRSTKVLVRIECRE